MPDAAATTMPDPSANAPTSQQVCTVARRGLVTLTLVAAALSTTAPTASAAPSPDTTIDAGRLIEQLHQPTGVSAPVPPATRRWVAAQETSPTEEPAQVFATVDGVDLVVPGQVRAIGYHESGDSRSLPMSPVGRLDANLNAERISLPDVQGDSPVEYMILPSRGRAAGPTSAVDVSMTHGEPVTAVATGTVTTVSDYTLYGTTPDQIVEIVPEDRPDLLVRLLHIAEVRVQVGDQVHAATTVLAGSARRLPFASQIDRYAGNHPHVHIEIHRRS